MQEYPEDYPDIFPYDEDIERAEKRRVSLLRAPSYLKRACIGIDDLEQCRTSRYLKNVDIDCDLAASPFAHIKTKLAFANAASATIYGFEWFATLTGFQKSGCYKAALDTGFRHLKKIHETLPFTALIRLEIKHVRHTDYTGREPRRYEYYEPHFHLAIMDAEKKDIRKALKKYPTEKVLRPLVLKPLDTCRENAKVMNYMSKGVQSHTELKLIKRKGIFEEVKTYTYEGPTKVTAGFYETNILREMGLKYWDFFATTKNLLFCPKTGFIYGNKKAYLKLLAQKTKDRLTLVIKHLDCIKAPYVPPPEDIEYYITEDAYLEALTAYVMDEGPDSVIL